MNQIFSNAKLIEKDSRNAKYYQVQRGLDTFKYIVNVYTYYCHNSQERVEIPAPYNLYIECIEDLDPKP
jgi:hypothetical protein